MSKITSEELTLLRSRPHATKLHLAIYRPKVSFAGRINDASIGKGETQLLYDSVITGSASNIQTNSTMLVGTLPGASDVGRVRVRSGTGSLITVAINQDVNWADDQYLTALNFHEVWPIYTQLEMSGETLIAYKDWDIGYVDQNSVLGTFICAGPHRACFAGESLYFSATGSYNVKDDTVSYQWTFEGSPSGTYTGMTPGWIPFPTAGDYTVKITATNSSGGVDTAYRHVMVRDRLGGAYPPIQKWALTELSGSRDEGGYSAKIEVWDAVPWLLDGALAVIFAEDWYGTTKQSIGGASPNSSSIVFVGYIVEGTIHYNWQTSVTEFQLVSVTDVMKRREGTSISVDDSANPKDWFTVLNMNLKRAIYHYLRWHSTVLEVADVRYIGYDKPVQFMETDSASIYDGLNEYLQNKIYGSVVADRQGLIFIEPGAEIVHNTTGTYPVNMSLLKQDWIGEPQLDQFAYDDLSYIEIGGWVYGGAPTGTSFPHLSAAPGDVRSYAGQLEVGQQGLIIDNQDELNRISGDIFAYRNAKYPNVSLSLAGNYRNLDIAPYEQILLTVGPMDTARGISFSSKAFHLTDMSWEYDPVKESFLPEIVLHELTQGFPGQTVEVPLTPGDNYPPNDDFNFNPPWFDFPPPNYSPLPVPPPLIAPPPDLPPDTEPGSEHLCYEDLSSPANGPWDTWISGEINNSNPRTVSGALRAIARAGAATYPTSYTVSGKWQKRLISGPSIGAWVDVAEDDWWQIYLLDGYGNRIGSGAHDPVSDQYVRTGHFNLASPMHIWGVQIAISPTVPMFDVDHITVDVAGHVWNVGKTSSVEWGAYENNSGIWVKAMGHWDVAFRLWTGPIVHIYPKTPTTFKDLWYQVDGTMTVESDKNLGKMVLTQQDSSYPERPPNVIAYDPNFIGKTGKLHGGVNEIKNVSSNTYLNLKAMSDAISGGYPPSQTFTCNVTWIIHPVPSYRLVITKVYLWNLCPWNESVE